jgi:hypothetical protein
MTFVSGLEAFSMQQPCLSAGFAASMGFADIVAFIGHPDGIPVFAVIHAVTRSAGRRNPVNIRKAVRSNGSVRRDIVCIGYVTTAGDDSKKAAQR